MNKVYEWKYHNKVLMFTFTMLVCTWLGIVLTAFLVWIIDYKELLVDLPQGVLAMTGLNFLFILLAVVAIYNFGETPIKEEDNVL